VAEIGPWGHRSDHMGNKMLVMFGSPKFMGHSVVMDQFCVGITT